MKLNTRQLGKIEVDEDKIINIPLGLPGFKDKKNYVLLQKEEMIPFLFFQCVDDPDLSFVVLDPVKIVSDYIIEQKELERVVSWDFKKETISCFVIVTIPNGVPEEMTANFMAPLVINNELKQGIQFIMDNSKYSHQHKLIQT